MPPPIEIARAQAAEHAEILALHREAGWPGTHVDGDVWAACEGGRIVGSVQLIALPPDVILIDAAVVRADARGRGIGADMLRHVLATRTAQWWLECREERIAFYELLGFVVDDDVPPAVATRVGPNPRRRQYFLRR